MRGDTRDFAFTSRRKLEEWGFLLFERQAFQRLVAGLPPYVAFHPSSDRSMMYICLKKVLQPLHYFCKPLSRGIVSSAEFVYSLESSEFVRH